MSESSQNPARTEFIAGLRQLADWLEQNPDVKIPGGERMLLPLTTNDAVEEFAATHGLTVAMDADGNASVDLGFGSIVYHVYGYANFADHLKRGEEKQARGWADKNDMIIQPRQAVTA